jgi:signal transduction histidine kinase
VARIRVRCVRRDGLEIVCEFSLTPLINEANDIVSVIAQCRDITQQIEAERVKKEFTSTLSHELRTPLTSIIGSLQLINTGMFGTLDQDAAELALVAERNAQRLLDLINDILDLERIDSGRLSLNAEDVSLDEVLQESVVLNRAYAERFGVRLKLLAEPPKVTVHADRRRLLQVMTNLISNAAKFSPEGGHVELSASCTDALVHGLGRGSRSRHPAGFPQPDLRALRASRFRADAKERRHRPRPCDLQAPDRADGRRDLVLRPRGRRHLVPLPAADARQRGFGLKPCPRNPCAGFSASRTTTTSAASCACRSRRSAR